MIWQEVGHYKRRVRDSSLRPHPTRAPAPPPDAEACIVIIYPFLDTPSVYSTGVSTLIVIIDTLI